jgi:hypothetical protein
MEGSGNGNGKWSMINGERSGDGVKWNDGKIRVGSGWRERERDQRTIIPLRG